MAGAPFPDLADELTDMCIHGICHNLTAMPGLRGIDPLESDRGMRDLAALCNLVVRILQSAGDLGISG